MHAFDFQRFRESILARAIYYYILHYYLLQQFGFSHVLLVINSVAQVINTGHKHCHFYTLLDTRYYLLIKKMAKSVFQFPFSADGCFIKNLQKKLHMHKNDLFLSLK